VIGINPLYFKQGVQLMIRGLRSKRFLSASVIMIKMAQSKKMTEGSFLDGVNAMMSGTQVVIFKFRDIVN
jgi:hypothetical protein